MVAFVGLRCCRFLCVCCPCTLRVPPSLPTRRSSDLRDRQDFAIGGRGVSVAPGQASPHRPKTAAALRRIKAGRNQPARGRDRKSTRLNSSHVKISYAVFCLKKKKRYHGRQCRHYLTT